MTVLGHSLFSCIFNLSGVCFLCWKHNGELQSNRWIRSDHLPIQSKPDLCINSWRSIKLINWCWSTLPLSPLKNLGALFVLLISEKLSLQLSWVMASFPCLTWFSTSNPQIHAGRIPTSYIKPCIIGTSCAFFLSNNIFDFV